MSSFSAIGAHVAKRIERLKKQEPAESLRMSRLYTRVAHDMMPATKPGAVVFEYAFARPGRGLAVPREKATAEELVRLVSAADREGITAAAIWVEHNFYAGDYSHLDAVRQACPELILIARDVVVDPWQIERCRAGGADAIELIPDLLGPALPAVAAGVHDFGLTPVTLDTSLRVHVL